MKIYKIEEFKNKEVLKFYRNLDIPQYNVCYNVDVTNLLKYVKTKKISFYYAMIYYSLLAMNRIDEFKYRINGDHVIYHDVIGPSFTELIPNTENFKIVTIDFINGLEEFIKYATESSNKQGDKFIDESKEVRDDLVYISCLPWISFTGLSHAISIVKDDAIPRLTWGKYFESNGKILIPLSVQVHHGFVNGLVLGKFSSLLQKTLDDISLED